MTNISLHIFWFFLIFLNCESSSKVKRPNDLIDENKFKTILLDVNLLEGHLTNLNVNMPDIRDNSLGKYKSIFTKHKVSFEQYKASYNFYSQQVSFKQMEEKVLDSLNKLEIYLQSQPEVRDLTFPQFMQLVEADSLESLFRDTTLSNTEKIDSMERFYNKFPEKIKSIGMDNDSFKQSMQKLRINEILYKSLVQKALNQLNKN